MSKEEMLQECAGASAAIISAAESWTRGGFSMIRLTVDGRTVEVPAGSTILDAVNAAGAHVPTLCHLKGNSPVASCRVCVVEVEGEPYPVPSCSTPARADMAVTTDSPQLLAWRRTALDLIIADHGLNSTNYCFSCEKNGACELQGRVPRAGRGVSELSRARRERAGVGFQPVPFLQSQSLHPLPAVCGRLQRSSVQPYAPREQAWLEDLHRGSVR